jgi:hypothetical protein
MPIVDAHIHYADSHPALLATLDDLDLKLLNVCVAQDAHGAWREQAERYGRHTRAHPRRYAWCTSFDLPRFHDPHYVDAVLQGLERDFAAGAVACKVWKNLGMEVRGPDGAFFMVDDPLLEPVFDALARWGRTLLMHMAEPLACWQPLDPETPHYGYYSQHPEWHMYRKPGYPAHADLMAARDRVVERHPGLRIVGAHLASLEYDVDQVAARLARFPNLAVDVSARLEDLACQDSAKVREFFLRFPDQILFGTDVVMGPPPSALAEPEARSAVAALGAVYAEHFAYFESGATVQVRGREVQGLGLPPHILDRFYRANAQVWYPGI